MKYLKIILYLLLAIITSVLIAAIFIPRSYTAMASETIKAPKNEVLNYLRMFGNAHAYSEWMKPDPNVKTSIVGTDGTVGAIQKWNGNANVGEGEQEITAITDDRFDIALRFVRPMESKMSASNFFTAIDSTTTEVRIEMYAKDEPYPLNFMSYLFGKSMLEKTCKKNLQNIKAILEK